MEIRKGTVVEATTASGAKVVMRALSGPERGRDFTIVWVCSEADYERSGEDADSVHRIPWPVDALRALATS